MTYELHRRALTVFIAVVALAAVSLLLAGCSDPDPVSNDRGFPETPTTTSSSAAEPLAAQSPLATALLPGPEWSVDSFSSVAVAPGYPSYLPRYAAVDGDIFGPVAMVYYLPDADYRRVGDSGNPFEELTSPGGRAVRLRTDGSPGTLTADVQVEPGSLVVIGYDLSQADLVATIDAIGTANGQASFEPILPAGMTPAPVGPLDLPGGTYRLQHAESGSMKITVDDGDFWQGALSLRAVVADPMRVTGDGFQGVVFGDGTGSREAGAILVTDRSATHNTIVTVSFLNPDPAIPAPTVDKVMELVQGFSFQETAPIFDALGLVDRAVMYGEWLASTPLPATSDLSWTLQGPPIDVVDEAFRAHRFFTCAWVGEWVTSGDTTALDQIEMDNTWPTAAILRDSGQSTSPFSSGSIADARTTEGIAARQTSDLATECSWPWAPWA